VGALLRVVEMATVRAEAALDSPQVGVLLEGELMCVQGAAVAKGAGEGHPPLRQRVRCGCGWVSIRASDGSLLLEPAPAPEDGPGLMPRGDGGDGTAGVAAHEPGTPHASRFAAVAAAAPSSQGAASPRTIGLATPSASASASLPPEPEPEQRSRVAQTERLQLMLGLNASPDELRASLAAAAARADPATPRTPRHRLSPTASGSGSALLLPGLDQPSLVLERRRTARSVTGGGGGAGAGDRRQLFASSGHAPEGAAARAALHTLWRALPPLVQVYGWQLQYHLRNINMATEIMDWLRFTYVFEGWYP
jgi:hypothetical protein